MEDKVEEEDELALFLEMQKDVFLDPGTSSPIFKIVSSPPAAAPPKPVDHKNDYNWLLTPPATPDQKDIVTENGTPKHRNGEFNSKFADCDDEPDSRGTCESKQNSSRINSSSGESCRPSSPDSQFSRASEPENPTEHPTVPRTAKSSRHVLPSMRANLQSSKPMVPTVRPVTCSGKTSILAARPKILACKSTSRSGTPTRRPLNPLKVSSVSVPPGRSSSVGKLGPKVTRNPAPYRGGSTVRSRPQKHPEIPGPSTDAPPNRTSLTDRHVSTSRCSRGTPNSNGIQKQFSPLRGRGPNGSVHINGSSLHTTKRTNPNDGDNVSPVLMGTKMVERVVNMRKLAPPKKNNQVTNNLSRKSSSRDSSGFGRTLSKSSLDMALRHMDIGGSTPINLQLLRTKVPASSIYNVKSGLPTPSVSDSPLATSSNYSSDLSFNSSTLNSDSSAPDDDLGSERR